MRGLSAKCRKLEFPGMVFLKKNPWTKCTSPWTALVWPVHGCTVDSTVSDGRGSSELGLAAALGHGGLPRGWRREGRDAGRLGGPLTEARTTVRRWHIGGGASTPSGHGAGTIEEGRRRGEGVRCSTGVWVPFYRVRWEAGAAAVIGAFMATVIRSEGGGVTTTD
jgi:hypothetical protein